MAATTVQLQALANDPVFRARMRNLIRQQCSTIQNQGSAAAGSNAYQLAYKLATGQVSPDPIIDFLVTRTNLIGSTVGVQINADGVVQVTTSATDADILSQLATDFPFLGGA